MSVWRRLQRVGKKAAKFHITASLQELQIECSRQYKPGSLAVVWSRRSRRYPSKVFECNRPSENETRFTHAWSVPENVEFITTLYRNEKAIQYEEKEWVCQIEDVGGKNTALLPGPSSTSRRRILATRQIDLSEFAEALPTQTNLKVVMRLASKKLTSAVLLLTLNAVIVKEGDATDEDMISIASLMSLSRAGSFNVGSGLTINDAGGLGSLSPSMSRSRSVRSPPSQRYPLQPNPQSNFHSDLSEITAKLEALEHGHFDNPIPYSTKKITHKLRENRASTVNEMNPSTNMGCVQRNDAAQTKTLILVSSVHEANEQENSNINESSNIQRPASTQSGQDLLAWCQEVTKSYWNIRVTDLTTSFQNGLAFCAILNHFFPDKIDYAKLSVQNPMENCRLAFDVASKLGIPRVLDPCEVTSTKRPPDLLSMMTYLHQIRTCCCERSNSNWPNNINPVNSLKSQEENDVQLKYVRTTDHSPSPTTNDAKIEENLSDQLQLRLAKHTSAQIEQTPQKKLHFQHPTFVRYEHMFAKARSLLQQARLSQLSPALKPDALPPLAQPRKSQLMSASLTTVNTVGVDQTKNVPIREISADAQLGSIKRASSTICIPDSDENSAALNGCTKFTPLSPNHHNVMTSKLLDYADEDSIKVKRLRLSQMNLFASGRGNTAPVPIRIGDHYLPSKFQHTSVDNAIIKDNVGKQNTYRYALCENASSNLRITKSNTTVSQSTAADYISNEQAELEQAQRDLDREAAILEERLRRQMSQSPGSAYEEQLLRRWFILVNRKNTLIRRGIQLSIMEKEDDLKKKMHMLQEELRQILSVEDYMKTDADRRREDLLLQDLVRLVNERDDMIQELDLHEKALAEELALENSTNLLPSNKRCVIQ